MPAITAAPETNNFADPFAEALVQHGLHAALGHLNATTLYRFTGVYYFEPDWVRSLALFDRENPELQVGDDVRMKESYCMYTARGGEPLIIENASEEPTWCDHAARDSVLSYVAVVLSDPSGAPLGTLCHFDFCSRSVPDGTLDLLQAVRPCVESYLWASGIVVHAETRFK